MTDEQGNNGIKPEIQTITLQPTDKYVLIVVDPINQELKTVAPNIQDTVEAAQIVAASLNAILQQVANEKKENASPIVRVPAFSRLRK